MSETQYVQFLLNGQPTRVPITDKHQTVLQYLRASARLTGTKEGCAEGDCGACTIVIGELEAGEVKYRALNGCILLLAQIHGHEVITVEGVQDKDGRLHPVQQALVDFHGSQCGFCTPGFVMSLYAHYRNNLPNDRQSLKDTLAGNLCRCTGYGPILAAGQAMYGYQSSPIPDTKTALQGIPHVQPVTDDLLFAPTSESELQEILQAHPTATLWAGGTDTGLWLTKKLQHLSAIVLLGGIKSLDFVEQTKTGIRIGAMCRYSDLIELFASKWPDFAEVIRRTGSTQIRNSGTVGGNIANGSPIGDMAPMLMVLGASLLLRNQNGQREVLLEDFFIAYGEQDLRPGEYLAEIHLPKSAERLHFSASKVSKRFDQDISAVLGAFAWELTNDKMQNVRIAFGGMAATPKRAALAEQTLEGKAITDQQIRLAISALRQDFTPLDDMRASAKYRNQIAGALLQKAFCEQPLSLAKAEP